MRFNDGFWLLKNGVKAFYGLQVTNAAQGQDEIVFQVSTRPIRHRGDTLGGPVLSVRVHSPSEGIIGVRIDHFKHIEPTPDIELFPDAHAPPVTGTVKLSSGSSKESGPTDKWSLSSGALSCNITENPYTLTFNASEGKHHTLTTAGAKHQAVYDVPAKWTINTAANASCLAQDPSSNPDHGSVGSSDKVVRYVHSELNISPGELFYGLGEQFTPFVKNGQSVSVWNRDGGTSSEQAYKCVPFYMSNRNYGVFVNHPGEVEVEVGSEKVSRVGVSVAGESLEYFVIFGETPLKILERYTRMTGRPAILPTWTFGLWLSTSFLTNYDGKTVSGFLQGMQERQCPVRVFHLDCFWMKGYEWCSFTFDPDMFPDPKAYLSSIKEKFGVKICVWINPYISQHSPIFMEGVKNGYFIKRSDGRTPWQWDLWQPGLAIVDFTNPAACEWYTGMLDKLIDLGVDTFKTDFGERIPAQSVVYHDGSDPYRMHNHYATVYNKLVFDLLKKRFGEGEAVVFARTGHAGGQRFPVHWGGDCESTFEAMAETLRGGLSLTTSGYAFTSHDIGGFEGLPPAEVYHRWVGYGLFSSHSRLHGSHSYRVPWEYGEEAAQYMAKYVDTKHRLMPYLYNLAIEAHHTGAPIQRAMFIEFPEDRTTHYLDRQFMLGPSLLVAPVFVPQAEETEYYLPAGRWTSFWHPDRVVEGPKWVSEVVPIDEIPVWVRPGTVLLLGPAGMGRPDYSLGENLEVRLYELTEEVSTKVGVPTGKTGELGGEVTVERKGGEIILRGGGSVSFASVALFGADVKSVAGGELDGQAVKTHSGVQEVTLSL